MSGRATVPCIFNSQRRPWMTTPPGSTMHFRSTADEARRAVRSRIYEVVFLDINLPEPLGEVLLKEFLELRPLLVRGPHRDVDLDVAFNSRHHAPPRFPGPYVRSSHRSVEAGPPDLRVS